MRVRQGPAGDRRHRAAAELDCPVQPAGPAADRLPGPGGLVAGAAGQQDQGDLWDSGKVAGDETAQVVYAGKPLGSRQACYWKVRAWDRDGQPGAWSAPARLGDGPLEARRLVGPLDRGPGRRPEPGMSEPVPILRKSFELADKPVAKARLFATALGLYEMHINGRRVGDHVLAPDWTDYRKRVRYQVYDVTSLLKPGENALAALLANGWYCGHIGNGGFQYYGKVPAFWRNWK